MELSLELMVILRYFSVRFLTQNRGKQRVQAGVSHHVLQGAIVPRYVRLLDFFLP
jgi:hypothetical protein